MLFSQIILRVFKMRMVSTVEINMCSDGIKTFIF